MVPGSLRQSGDGLTAPDLNDDLVHHRVHDGAQKLVQDSSRHAATKEEAILELVIAACALAQEVGLPEEGVVSLVRTYRGAFSRIGAELTQAEKDPA